MFKKVLGLITALVALVATTLPAVACLFPFGLFPFGLFPFGLFPFSCGFGFPFGFGFGGCGFGFPLCGW